jgi:hypothetical protein
MTGDLVDLDSEQHDSTPVLVPAMRHGERTTAAPQLAELRKVAATNLLLLPDELRQLRTSPYPVAISSGLRRLADKCDRRIADQYDE